MSLPTRREVRRSDTSIFRQVSPGLVLLLIGETDDDGLPTATRTLVTATYPPEQELSRGGELVGLNMSVQEGGVGEALQLGEDATITLRDVLTVADQPDLPAGQQVLVFNLDVRAGVDDLDTIIVAGGGLRCGWAGLSAEQHSRSTYADYGALPLNIPSLSLIPASVGYHRACGSSKVGGWSSPMRRQGVSFRFTFAAPPTWRCSTTAWMCGW